MFPRRDRVHPLTERRQLAHAAGYRAGAAGITYEDAVVVVVQRPNDALTAREAVAYAQLLPATWWSSFNAGFQDGRHHWDSSPHAVTS